MQSQYFNSFAFRHATIDNSGVSNQDSLGNVGDSSVMSSYGRESVFTSLTKTTKFFSFFSDHKSKIDSSACSSMLQELGNQIKKEDQNHLRSHQIINQCDSTFESNTTPLNKTQMFMQAFKLNAEESEATVRNFKKNKQTQSEIPKDNQSDEELTTLIEQTRKENNLRQAELAESNKNVLIHCQPNLRAPAEKNVSLQISHISDNLESSLSDTILWPQEKQLGSSSIFATDKKHELSKSQMANQDKQAQTLRMQNERHLIRTRNEVLRQERVQHESAESEEKSQDDVQDEQEQQEQVDDGQDWQSEQKSQSSVVDEDEHEERVIKPFQIQQINQQTPLQPETKKSMIIGIYCYTELVNQMSSIKESIVKYFPSNYFHVGPRRQILSFLTRLLTETNSIGTLSPEQIEVKYSNCVDKIINSQKISSKTFNQVYQQCLRNVGIEVRRHFSDKIKKDEILEICAEYNGSNYFHVGKRRFLFSEIEFVIKLVQNMKQTLNTKGESQASIDTKEKSMAPIGKSNEPSQIQQKRMLPVPQQLQSTIKTFSIFSEYSTNHSAHSTQQSFSVLARSPQSQKNEAVGKYLSQHLNKALVSSLQKTIMQYHSSNYFHVGPRYEVLNFMSGLVDFVKDVDRNFSTVSQNDKENALLVKAGEKVKAYLSPTKMESVMSICHSYHSSNYFHVGPRYSILGDVRFIVGVYKEISTN